MGGPPLMPPDPSFPAIDTNWFQDSFWTGTVVPEITTAQNGYTTAKNAVNAYEPTYQASLTTLNTEIADALLPTATQTDLNNLLAAITDFETKALNRQNLITDLQNASVTLIQKFRQAQAHVDDSGDSELDGYVSNLTSSIGLELALEGVNTNTLSQELTSANDARNAARSDFLSKLNSYQDAELAVTQARIDLIVLEDELEVAEGQVARWTLQLKLDQELLATLEAVLAQEEQDVVNAQAQLNAAQAALDLLSPGDPGYAAALAARNAAQANLTTQIAERNAAQLAVDNQEAVVAFDQTQLAQAIVTRNALQADVSTQTNFVATKITERNSARSQLNSSLGTYEDSLDELISVLEDGYNLHSAIPQQFADAIADARTQAQALVDQALQAVIDNDLTLRTQHETDFPTIPPNSVLAEVIEAEQSTIDKIREAQAGFDTTQVSRAVAEIDIPELPPGGLTSINDLMRFISSIQRFITRLANAIRQADNNIDSLRLRIWDLQLALEAQETFTLIEWANTVIDADFAYNTQVGRDNHELSQAIYDQIFPLLNDPATRQIVIDTVQELNDDIADQNQRGVDITTALNNANFVRVDLLNANRQIGPNITNTNDIFMLEADQALPPAETDSATATIPGQIPPYPDFDTSGLPPIPQITHSAEFLEEFPDHEPVHDAIPIPDVGVDPNDPLDEEFFPDEEDLPTQAMIDDINVIIDYFNDYLAPLQERLQANGLDFEPINQLYVRQYVPIRTFADIIDIDSAFTGLDNIVDFITSSEEARRFEDISAKGPTPTPFDRLLDSDRQPVTEDQHLRTEGLGAGSGILSANILATPSSVGGAVQTVLGSQTFLAEAAALIEQSSFIAGLQTATLFPTTLPNFSQLGLVRSDLVGEVGDFADARVNLVREEGGEAVGEEGEIPAEISQEALATALEAEDPLQALATLLGINIDAELAGSTAINLIELAGDGETLRQRVSSILQQVGPLGLTTDETEELIAALLLLVQLLLLLLASLLAAQAAVAAGGGTQVEVIARVVETPDDRRILIVIDDIIELLPDDVVIDDEIRQILQSRLDSRFEGTVADLLVDRLPVDTVDTFREIITDIFRQRDIVIDLSEGPVGPTITDALQGAPIDVRGVIRNEIIQAEIENAEILRNEVLRESLRRPDVRERIRAEVNRQILGLDPELRNQTIALLVAEGVPQFQQLTPDDQNVVVLALALEIITIEQANAIILAIIEEQERATDVARAFSESTRERAEESRDAAIQEQIKRGDITQERDGEVPIITQLLARATENLRIQRAQPQTATAAPAATIATPRVPQTAGETGQVAAPSALPKDPVELLRDAALRLSEQTDVVDFVEETFREHLTRTESDRYFYDRSIDLLLNPAGLFNKSFSIVTMDSTTSESRIKTQIPIVG